MEPHSLEHRHRAIRRFIPERARLPATDRISLDQSPTFLFDGIQRGVQSSARYSPLAPFLGHYKTGNSPHIVTVFFGSKTPISPISPTVIDTRKFVFWTILTPTHGLAAIIDKDSVGAPLLNQHFLFAAIPHSSLTPGAQPLALRQRVGPMKMHAPAMIPTAPLREELGKVGPSFEREFPGCERRERHDNESEIVPITRFSDSSFLIVGSDVCTWESCRRV